jgi:1-deoxy-D-xylulose-5-phosphate reductoisomerase
MSAAGMGGAPRRVILLGSTGSIGCSTLEVLAHLEADAAVDFRVVGLAAGANADRLREQAARWNVKDVAIADASARDALDGVGRVFAGENAARELVESIAREGDLVVAAMVGAAGLPATIAAIGRGCDIALANKETLVAAGALVLPLVRARDTLLLPVDSEHSAIAQCLRAGRSTDEVRRLVLTASGGPFRVWPKERVETARPEDALAHPTWSMGRKITVDSASMMNKALEVIEAHWLFGLPADRIEVVVHPQSIVHSFVEFVDGSVMAQLSPPDMRTPIQYALTWPARRDGCAEMLDFSTMRRLDFEPVDHGRFPAVRMAYDVIERGGTCGAVFNAANEAAVEAFLDHRIAFGAIPDLVGAALGAIPPVAAGTLEAVLAADADARAFVADRVGDAAAPTPARVRGTA